MAKFERQVELAMPPQEALHRLYTALAALPQAATPRVEGQWVTTTIGTSMWSWGETVAAYVQASPRGSLITVRSKSAFALVDWGKNKKNVEKALAGLNAPAPPQR